MTFFKMSDDLLQIIRHCLMILKNFLQTLGQPSFTEISFEITHIKFIVILPRVYDLLDDFPSISWYASMN